MRGDMPPEIVTTPIEKLHGDIPLEFILRKAAACQGNVQDAPYLWAVHQSIDLINSPYLDNFIMRSARKEHACQKCDQIIRPGELYVREKIDAIGYESIPYCISCAARHLINFYKVYLYAPARGFTHWSVGKNGPISCKDENGRFVPLWKPAEISPEIRARLKQSGDLLREEMSDIPTFSPEEYHPLTDSLLAAADGDDTIEAYSALEEAVSNSGHIDKNHRWRLIEGLSTDCFGCGENLSKPSKTGEYRPAFYVCGEETDFLCPRCAAKVILTVFVDRVLDWQIVLPYFFDTRHGTTCFFDDLRKQLFGEYKDAARREYYQDKINNGISIEDIAREEKFTVSAVRQRLNRLGVILPDRRNPKNR